MYNPLLRQGFGGNGRSEGVIFPHDLRGPLVLFFGFLCHKIHKYNLVGGLVAIFYFPISWKCHHPNWRSHIFQDGVAFKPPTSCSLIPSLQCCHPLGRRFLGDVAEDKESDTLRQGHPELGGVHDGCFIPRSSFLWGPQAWWFQWDKWGQVVHL